MILTFPVLFFSSCILENILILTWRRSDSFLSYIAFSIISNNDSVMMPNIIICYSPCSPCSLTIRQFFKGMKFKYNIVISK